MSFLNTGFVIVAGTTGTAPDRQVILSSILPEAIEHDCKTGSVAELREVSQSRLVKGLKLN